MTADRYRSERVFLAGDSAHQVIPTGGYGMNTGVGDAVDLGWKLAAFVNGWGGETLLNSYEAERRPIAEQNAAMAVQNLEVRLAIADAIAAGEAQGDLNTPISRPSASKSVGKSQCLATRKTKAGGLSMATATNLLPSCSHVPTCQRSTRYVAPISLSQGAGYRIIISPTEARFSTDWDVNSA